MQDWLFFTSTWIPLILLKVEGRCSIVDDAADELRILLGYKILVPSLWIKGLVGAKFGCCSTNILDFVELSKLPNSEVKG